MKIFEGNVVTDDRGQVSFVNDFDFKGVKRFYTVENHKPFVRAWHGHKKEGKYVLVTRGAIILGTVKIDNWKKPNPDADVERIVLTAKKPAVVHIPKGHANGFKTLTDDTQVMFFSDKTLKQSQGDDYRFPARYWDIWDSEER